MAQICFNANVHSDSDEPLAQQTIDERQVWLEPSEVRELAIHREGDPEKVFVRLVTKTGEAFFRRFDDEGPGQAEWHAHHWRDVWSRQNLGRPSDNAERTLQPQGEA